MKQPGNLDVIGIAMSFPHLRIQSSPMRHRNECVESQYQKPIALGMNKLYSHTDQRSHYSHLMNPMFHQQFGKVMCCLHRWQLGQLTTKWWVYRYTKIRGLKPLLYPQLCRIELFFSWANMLFLQRQIPSTVIVIASTVIAIALNKWDYNSWTWLSSHIT